MKLTRWRIAFILAFFACAPVSPRAEKQSTKPDEQRGGPQLVVPPTAPHEPSGAPPETPGTHSKPRDWHEWFWPPIWSNWALVLVAGLAAWAAFRTLSVIDEEVSATKLAAEAAKASAEASILAERAYVTMSHLPPGLMTDHIDVTAEDGIPTRTYDLRLKIQNFGNTPATITDLAVIRWSGIELPPKPPLPKKGSGANAFLVKGDFFISEHSFHVPVADLDDNMLYILGAIEYTDQFGRRHRSGYARFYARNVDERFYARQGQRIVPIPVPDDDAYRSRNNLRYCAQPGYNYDIEIDEQGNPKRQKPHGSDS